MHTKKLFFSTFFLLINSIGSLSAMDMSQFSQDEQELLKGIHPWDVTYPIGRDSVGGQLIRDSLASHGVDLDKIPDDLDYRYFMFATEAFVIRKRERKDKEIFLGKFDKSEFFGSWMFKKRPEFREAIINLMGLTFDKTQDQESSESK